jgi:hypothetical protein
VCKLQTLEGIRKLALLALIGFAVVILSGPLLAIVSVVFSIALVLLVFAFVGLLVVGAVQILLGRQFIDWQNVHDLKNATGKTFHHFRGAFGWVLALPKGIGIGLAMAVQKVSGFLWNTAKATVRIAGEITLMTVIGGIVGMAWEGINGPIHQDPGFPIPLNAILGGMIGALVGMGMVILGIRGRSRFRSVVVH